MNYKDQLYLQHYGVQGMKWGVHRRTRALLGAVAIRKVGGAYANAMAKKQINIQKDSDRRIKNIQNETARRIKEAKSGEDMIRLATTKYSEAMRNKANKIDSVLASKSEKKINRLVSAFDKDLKSFEPYLKTGIKTKSGKVIFTSKQVEEMHSGIMQVRDKAIAKVKKQYGQ